ncbi:prefoldin subunit alpha [Candidatus Woesearchaeota archaeon]|nr:prefoldin subunit alpha [Candidatus Woesearchaeota archaeon]
MAKEENMKKEKELQQKFVEFQMLQQQASQLQKQIQQMHMQKKEIESITQNLDELNRAEKGAEILAPVASGIFAKASLENKDDFLVNVGNNVVVKKSLAEVKELLSKQAEEVGKVEKKMSSNLHEIASAIQQVEEELGKMIEEAKEDV